MNDADARVLVAGLAAGEASAFERLYDLFGTRMYRTALRILGRPEDAEDAVQDVFLSLVRSHRRLRDVNDVTSYLFLSLRRAAWQRARDRKRYPHVPLIEPVTAAHSSVVDGPGSGSECIDRALRGLPMEQREVLSLKVDGGLTFAEIARIVGVSIHTAASRYRYAIERLRDRLSKIRRSP